jgi:hypothetical protein
MAPDDSGPQHLELHGNARVVSLTDDVEERDLTDHRGDA